MNRLDVQNSIEFWNSKRVEFLIEHFLSYGLNLYIY